MAESEGRNILDSLTLVQALIKSSSSTVAQAMAFGIIGWIAQALNKERCLNTAQWVGGVLMSGFIAWVICKLLLSTGLSSQACAATAAVLASGGEKIYNLLLDRELKKLQGDSK